MSWVCHDEEEGALVRSAIEEADDVGMLESGDEIINVVLVVSDLPFVEIAKRIAHGAGGVAGEITLGGIEKSGCVCESFLGCQFNFGMRQAGNIGELACDFGSEGKEVVHQFFHDGDKLSCARRARLASGNR